MKILNYEIFTFQLGDFVQAWKAKENANILAKYSVCTSYFSIF